MSSGVVWIGWRLLVGKGGGVRQAGLITFGVAIGSALLFAMASIPSAVADRQERDSTRGWLLSGAEVEHVDGDGVIAVGHDLLGDEPLTHLLVTGADIASVGPLPAVGSTLVSPALESALGADSSLAERFAGEVVGTVPDPLLAEPGELVSLTVVEPEVVLATGDARAMPTNPPPEGEVEVVAAVVYVASVALLVLAVPVVMFISSATQLGLERRRARVRTLSLSGADRSQIRVFVMMEAVSAAVLGLLLGFGLFQIVRPLLARLRVGGRTMFVSALDPVPILAVLVVVSVLVGAVVAALVGSRRLDGDSITRRRRAPGVGFAVIGLGSAGLVVGVASPSDTDAPHPLALAGMAVMAIGLTLVGRTVIAWFGRRTGSRTGDAVVLLAARRMDRHPSEVNRPLTSVVTAVFVVAAFFTITGTLLRSSNFRFEGMAADRIVVEASPEALAAVRDGVGALPGVDALVLQGIVSVVSTDGEPLLGVVTDCVDAMEVAELASDCRGGVVASDARGLAAGTPLVVGSNPPLQPPGVTTTVEFEGVTFHGEHPASVIIDRTVVPSDFAAQISEAQLVIRMVPGSDIERLRTGVVSALPTAHVRSVSEIEYDQNATARELRSLATIGLVLVLGLGAVSLAVGTASRLLQRRDALIFLRAGGLLPGQIRMLVAVESIVPLAGFSAVGAVLGTAAGAAVAVSAGTTPVVPWATIGVIYLVGVALGILVWAGIAPAVDRLTSPSGLRFE